MTIILEALSKSLPAARPVPTLPGAGGRAAPATFPGQVPPADEAAFEAAFNFAMRRNNDGQPFHVTPGDSGGATAWGIIKPTLATYLGHPVTDEDIRALTPEKAKAIYRKLFWNGLECPALPEGLDVYVFDFACSNPSAAKHRLQRALGVADDGKIGPITIAAAHKADMATVLASYHRLRIEFYRMLSTYPRFGRGWERRANEALGEARRVAGLPVQQ